VIRIRAFRGRRADGGGPAADACRHGNRFCKAWGWGGVPSSRINRCESHGSSVGRAAPDKASSGYADAVDTARPTMSRHAKTFETIGNRWSVVSTMKNQDSTCRCQSIYNAAFSAIADTALWRAPSVPSQHETVNPVRPGREQPQQWMCVPGCGWWGPPPHFAAVPRSLSDYG